MTIIIGIKIASIGDGALELAGTVTDGRYRLATGTPSFDTSSLYRSVLAEFPSEVGTFVDFQTGDTSVSGQEFKLLPTLEVLGWLLRPNFARETTLATALTKAATTVVLDGDPSDDTTITIGRECIVLGTGTTTTTTSFASCLRGALGTMAAAHGVDATDDVEAFIAGESPVTDLVVELFTVDSAAASYASETTFWRGVLRPATWDGASGMVKLTADALIDTLKQAKLCQNIWQGEGDGSFYYGWTPIGAVPDADPEDGGDPEEIGNPDTLYPVVLFDGDSAVRTLLVKAFGERVVVWPTRRPDITFMPVGGSQLPEPNERGYLDFKERVWQLHGTAVGMPAVNDAGDTLSANAITLTLQLLTTTTEGDNGDHDLGVSNLGCGIPASLLDVTGMEALASEFGSVVELRSLFFPLDGKPVDAHELVTKRILRPFGFVLAPGSGGKYTVKRLEAGAVDSTAIGEADCVAPPNFSVRGVSPVDSVEVTWGEMPGLGSRTDTANDGYNRARSLIAQGAQLSVDAGGVNTAPAAAAISLAWVTRYHFPIPVIEVELKRSVALDLWPGDAVAFTHSALPGRSGARGVTSELMIVAGREDSLERWTTRLTLWWTSAAIAQARRIAPGARVSSWSDPTLTIEANAFKQAGGSPTTDAGVWADLLSLAGNLSVLILDSDLSVLGTATVTGSGTNTLTLSGASVSPSAGDVIVLADYDTVGDEERARYAFLADANDTLGAGSDDPAEWLS